MCLDLIFAFEIPFTFLWTIILYCLFAEICSSVYELVCLSWYMPIVISLRSASISSGKSDKSASSIYFHIDLARESQPLASTFCIIVLGSLANSIISINCKESLTISIAKSANNSHIVTYERYLWIWHLIWECFPLVHYSIHRFHLILVTSLDSLSNSIASLKTLSTTRTSPFSN